MNDKLKPALIGGVILGILSAIPFVNIPNICCCAWAIVGGIIAANLYVKGSPVPVRTGDGAVVGVLAGVFGGILYLIIGVPINYVTGNAMMSVLTNMIASSNPEQAEQLRMQMASASTVAGVIINGIILTVLLIIFATVGGLIGVAIFEKRKGGAPPPPPPGGYGQGM
jgi:hypothetical protein